MVQFILTHGIKKDKNNSMRITIISLVILTFGYQVFAQQNTNSIYQYNINTLNKQTIAIKTFTGKKILVIISNVAHPDKAKLALIDSIYKQNINKVCVITIPVSDIGNDTYSLNEFIRLVYDTLKLSHIIAEVSKGKKSTGKNQLAFLKYLTDKTANGHFDDDIQSDGDIIIISEKGSVFARFTGKIPISATYLQKLIDKKID
jgi:glutathione peroxidase-family protein